MIGPGVRCPTPVVGCLTLGDVVLGPSKVDEPPRNPENAVQLFDERRILCMEGGGVGLVKLIQIAVTNLVVRANNREGEKQHNA